MIPLLIICFRSWSFSFYVSGGLIAISSIIAFLIEAEEKENVE